MCFGFVLLPKAFLFVQTLGGGGMTYGEAVYEAKDNVACAEYHCVSVV